DGHGRTGRLNCADYATAIAILTKPARREGTAWEKNCTQMDTCPEVLDFAMKSISWKPFYVARAPVQNYLRSRKSLVCRVFFTNLTQILFVRPIDQIRQSSYSCVNYAGLTMLRRQHAA